MDNPKTREQKLSKRAYYSPVSTLRNNEVHASQGRFNETLSRYLNNSKRIREIRDGCEQHREIDWKKVIYTTFIQSVVIAIVILCITTWMLWILPSVAVFEVINAHLLLKS